MNHFLMSLPAKSKYSYPIFIQKGLLFDPKKWLDQYFSDKFLVIITDDIVKNLYGNALQTCLKEHGYQTLLLSFPPGENSKTYRVKEYLEEKMFAHLCTRDTVIIALGGGVVGDLAGFIAATYMRGISYIQIPTSLLAMIDSSIGGKTGINTAHGKNLIGAFWQPSLVLIDLQCTNTLSENEIINGLIEAIKIFLTHSLPCLEYVASHLNKAIKGDIESLEFIVTKAIQLKMEVVQQDLEDKNLRQVLNFGHTIGHALEALTDYQISHGTAVALGILVEAKISQLQGLLTHEEYQKIVHLFSQLGLTQKMLFDFDPVMIIEKTHLDKKNFHQEVKYILLEKLGKFHVSKNQVAHTISDEQVLEAFNILQETNRAR